VSRLASFFDILHQDPVLNRAKLIAEPWDVSLGGYQVGNFPVDWAEWNGRYRDTVRRYWRGEPGMIADLVYRLTGSSYLYRDDGRSPGPSINFITCHDGFTACFGRAAKLSHPRRAPGSFRLSRQHRGAPLCHL